MQNRGIAAEWIYRIIEQPTYKEPDPIDPELERFYAVGIDGRVLRVVVNTHSVPWRIITVFPDRNMRGKL